MDIGNDAVIFIMIKIASFSACRKEAEMKADIKWLDNPEIYCVNRLDAHSDHMYFESYEEIGKSSNKWEVLLDGLWKFHYSKNAASRPADFYREDYDRSDFDTIKVPGHIELQGYDKIHYINTMYPWEGHEYYRPAFSLPNAGKGEGAFSDASYNPVGSYVCQFDLPNEFHGERTIVCFEGVEQAMYVWLNGYFLGYAEDSFTPSEFDLTPYIKNTGNILAVEVYKRSTAAFLEDQDFFRFFGIFRSVKLKAKPYAHVEDIFIHPILLDTNENGKIDIKVKLSLASVCDVHATAVLKDNENICWKSDVAMTYGNNTSDSCLEVNGFVSGLIPQKVIPWENRNPYLYNFYLEVKDKDENIIEVVPYRVGFRRLEIIDKVICLNGKRLILTGVNRHEWEPHVGRCITEKEMKIDLMHFEKNHINAVRTCHYPNQIPWYYMCDEAGIYMMSETNLESHGSWQKMGEVEPSYNVPGSLPEWKNAVIDRAKNNYETFKNHTSVLFWSLGNESYAGDDIAEMNKYFMQQEDGRLVHYEGVSVNRKYEDEISQIESRMYATPDEVRAYLSSNPKKPYLLCEFMHSMGNSLGGMSSYMSILDEYMMFHGGFIWDYIDQAIYVKDEVTGEEVLRYGGDFDDRPTDYNFSGNGIVFADRTEKPAMQEVNYYYGKYK